MDCSLIADSDDEMDFTYIGGKKFKRVKVHQRTDFTPGVRRSKRRRIAPIQPGEHLEYQLHYGMTPSKSYGQCSHTHTLLIDCGTANWLFL